MQQYLNLLREILESDNWKPSRGKVNGVSVGTKVISGAFMKHDLRKGFPLFTTKFTPLRLIASELVWFISGLGRKEPLLEMDNHIWDEWWVGFDKPDAEQRDKNDLGRVYGVQWRHWQKYISATRSDGFEYDSQKQLFEVIEVDQFNNILERLKTNPYDRRMLCYAFNPAEIEEQALPACHTGFQIISTGIDKETGKHKISLSFNMRSVDMILGFSFNFASYSLLLMLIAKQLDMIPETVSAHLVDTHIYDNHIEGAKLMLDRVPYELPTLTIKDPEDGSKFDIYKWKHTDLILENYKYHPKIKFDVAT